MSQYLNAQQVASQLGYSERMIRIYADRYDWFGGRLGNTTGSWVFTQDEVDRMRTTSRPSAGRPPRNPIVNLGDAPPNYVPVPN